MQYINNRLEKIQEFPPNHYKRCSYSYDVTISNYQEKKSHLIIFINNESFQNENGAKNPKYEFISLYLSLISNYNLNEINNLNFTINRNHQPIKNIFKMKHKEEENIENNEFFLNAGESITIFLLFQYTKEVVPSLKNYAANRSFKPLKFNVNCISKNKIIKSFKIFEHFKVEDGKFTFSKILSTEDYLNQLIEDTHNWFSFNCSSKSQNLRKIKAKDLKREKD